MKAWLLGAVLTAFAAELARQLAPSGRERSLVRLVGALLLALAILRPLASRPRRDQGLESPGEGWGAPEEAYQKDWMESLSAVIAEKTEAYIWDKANRLGLACQVAVTVSAGENGVPLPDTASILGPYSAALAGCMEEVGIPAEKQIWLEEEAWTEKSGG